MQIFEKSKMINVDLANSLSYYQFLSKAKVLSMTVIKEVVIKQKLFHLRYFCF